MGYLPRGVAHVRCRTGGRLLPRLRARRCGRLPLLLWSIPAGRASARSLADSRLLLIVLTSSTSLAASLVLRLASSTAPASTPTASCIDSRIVAGPRRSPARDETTRPRQRSKRGATPPPRPGTRHSPDYPLARRRRAPPIAEVVLRRQRDHAPRCVEATSVRALTPCATSRGSSTSSGIGPTRTKADPPALGRRCPCRAPGGLRANAIVRGRRAFGNRDQRQRRRDARRSRPSGKAGLSPSWVASCSSPNTRVRTRRSTKA